MSELYEIACALDEAGIGGRDLVERVKSALAALRSYQERDEEAAKRPDLERLLAGLDTDRSQELMLIADALLDEGRDREAACWAWLGQAGRWPTRDRTTLKGAPCWYMNVCLPRAGSREPARLGAWREASHFLPLTLIDWAHERYRFTSPGEALQSLVAWMVEINWQAGKEE